MDSSTNNALESPDNPMRVDPSQPIATPHFDEQAIHEARPAVPLAQIKAGRFRRLALVLVCGSGLVGGLGMAISRYRNRSAEISPPAAALRRTSPPRSVEPVSPPATDPAQRATDIEPDEGKGTAKPSRDTRPAESPNVTSEPMTGAEEGGVRARLNVALDEWLAATNARDLERQMGFYHQKIDAFYLTRNVAREAVRAEKSRLFSHADVVDIRAAAPGIRVSPDGRTATMRFRKKYAIEGGGENRHGEVLQELRWRRTAHGWKIISERDLRVIH